MKKFICGFLAGAMLFCAIGALAISYVANPVDFKVLVNGEEFISNPPALEVEGRTYLPLRAMGDALGVDVNWNEELRQAEVGTKVEKTLDVKEDTFKQPVEALDELDMSAKLDADLFDSDLYVKEVSTYIYQEVWRIGLRHIQLYSDENVSIRELQSEYEKHHATGFGEAYDFNVVLKHFGETKTKMEEYNRLIDNCDDEYFANYWKRYIYPTYNNAYQAIDEARGELRVVKNAYMTHFERYINEIIPYVESAYSCDLRFNNF